MCFRNSSHYRCARDPSPKHRRCSWLHSGRFLCLSHRGPAQPGRRVFPLHGVCMCSLMFMHACTRAIVCVRTCLEVLCENTQLTRDTLVIASKYKLPPWASEDFLREISCQSSPWDFFASFLHHQIMQKTFYASHCEQDECIACNTHQDYNTFRCMCHASDCAMHERHARMRCVNA